MATAIDAYDEMVRLVIRPALRDVGFKGSGSTFTWPSERSIALVGMQRSQFGDRNLVRFTLNVTVADAEAWERARKERPHLPRRPAPNTFYGSFIWQQRIGKLMPTGEDHWWSLDGSTDITEIGDEVVAAIRTYVVPELKARA